MNYHEPAQRVALFNACNDREGMAFGNPGRGKKNPLDSDVEDDSSFEVGPYPDSSKLKLTHEGEPECEALYKESNSPTRLLVTMVIGMTNIEEDRNLGDLKNPPYCDIKQKNQWKPNGNGMKC